MENNIKMENQSVVQMEDLYFSDFEFRNKREFGKKNLTIQNRVEYEPEKENIRIRIFTEVKTSDDDLYLKLVTVGVFKVPTNIESATKESIERINTVAMMFPFIRSEIALLTSQPGLYPIMMPPVDVNELVKNQK